jgi:hypothetical protein
MSLGRLPALRRGEGGRRVLTYWGALGALLVFAGLPLAILSATAPSSQVEGGAGISRIRGIVEDRSGSTSAGTDVPSPSTTESPEAELTNPPQQKANGAAIRPPAPEGPSKAGQAGLDAGFEVQCWPDLDVVPGRSASVDCSIPLHNGYTGEISLSCRVAGMSCELNPNRVVAVADRNAMSTRLTVTAPGSASVALVIASVSATEGETGSEMKTADVRVNVPPPFLVRCESVGTSFVRGEPAAMKCWVSFHHGFSDEVALRIVGASGVPAALDTASLAAAPDQTRAFNIEIDTAALAPGIHSVNVEVSSNRYLHEAAAVFSVAAP